MVMSEEDEGGKEQKARIVRRQRRERNGLINVDVVWGHSLPIAGGGDGGDGGRRVFFSRLG
jgi:hypothetical protein